MQAFASKEAVIQDLTKQLAVSEKERAEVKETYNRLKAEHDEWSDLIAALRQQIKETKDALERNGLKLQDIKANVANLTDISFETLHRVLKKEVTPQTRQLHNMNGSHDGFKQVKIDFS